MTEGPIDASKILMPIPKFEQGLSIYIFLSPAKTIDFMHPKREGCIVIYSLIFVDKNIFLYCLNLSKDYQWTSNKKIKMTEYIKELHTAIFTGQMGSGKTHLVLELIENYYNKHFDYIVIICLMLRENSTYHAKEWIKSDDKVWLVDPKDNLYQWIEKLSQLLSGLETLFIIEAVSVRIIYLGRHRGHYP